MPNAVRENTRLKILKELSHGARIPTDISRRLNRSTPTIVEHLEKLAATGLVERREQPGKKYVFYALTQNGSELVLNQSRLLLMLYGSAFLFILGITLFGVQVYSRAFTAAALINTGAAPQASAVAAPLQAVTVSFAALLMLMTAFILLFLYIRKLRKIRITISD